MRRTLLSTTPPLHLRRRIPQHHTVPFRLLTSARSRIRVERYQHHYKEKISALQILVSGAVLGGAAVLSLEPNNLQELRHRLYSLLPTIPTDLHRLRLSITVAATSMWEALPCQLHELTSQPIDPKHTAMAILAGINTAVFLTWQVAMRRKNPYLLTFMTRHFTCSIEGLRAGQLHTLLTSAFSHMHFLHLMGNLLGIVTLANVLIIPTMSPSPLNTLSQAIYTGTELTRAAWHTVFESLGMSELLASSYPKRQGLDLWEFTSVYVASATVASLLSLTVRAMNALPSTRTMGASGAVSGLITLCCLLQPNMTLYLLGVLPLSSEQALVSFTLLNLAGSLFRQRSHIDHLAHLGGQVVGFAFYTHEQQPLPDWMPRFKFPEI